jgi:antitoxin component of RelBE/YafQ-DinJ toxin-antitoxin module
MNEKITFRINEELKKDLFAVNEVLREEGLDLDASKIIRYLINQGLDKLRYDGKLK